MQNYVGAANQINMIARAGGNNNSMAMDGSLRAEKCHSGRRVARSVSQYVHMKGGDICKVNSSRELHQASQPASQLVMVFNVYAPKRSKTFLEAKANKLMKMYNWRWR